MRLEEFGFTDEEVKKIKMIAKIFKCQRMILIDKKPNV